MEDGLSSDATRESRSDFPFSRSGRTMAGVALANVGDGGWFVLRPNTWKSFYFPYSAGQLGRRLSYIEFN